MAWPLTIILLRRIYFTSLYSRVRKHVAICIHGSKDQVYTYGESQERNHGSVGCSQTIW